MSGDESEERLALHAEIPGAGVSLRVRVAVHEAVHERSRGGAGHRPAELLFRPVRDHADDRVFRRERRVVQVSGRVVELRGVVGAVRGIRSGGAVVHAHARDAHVVSARCDKAAKVDVVGVARVGARRVVAELRGGEIAMVGYVDVVRLRDGRGRIEVGEHVRPRIVRHVHVGAVERIAALVVAVYRKERDRRGNMLVEHRLHVPDFVCIFFFRQSHLCSVADDRCCGEVSAGDDGVKSRVRRKRTQQADRLLRLGKHAGRPIPIRLYRIRRGIIPFHAPALVEVSDECKRDVLALAGRGVDRVHLVDYRHDVRLEPGLKRRDIVSEGQKPRSQQYGRNEFFHLHLPFLW